MKSNFEFLKNEDDLQKYYANAVRAEMLYARGLYSEEVVNVRKIAEQLARDIMDLEYLQVDDRSTFNDNLGRLKRSAYITDRAINVFYEVKRSGNVQAHALEETATKDTGLTELKNIWFLLTEFANKYYDAHVDTKSKFKEPEMETDYSSSERRLVYIQTADNSSGNWTAYIGARKIGKASIEEDFNNDLRPNSDYLRIRADKRVKQYMGTGGVPYVIEWAELGYSPVTKRWFGDEAVHDVLKRSGIKHAEALEGNEWYKVDLETAKKAIQAVKDGKSAIELDNQAPKQQKPTEVKITLRPEQRDAIDKTKAAYKHYKRMLWNAKMRFGKTITALSLVKEYKYKKVLIMTHRPVVNEGWFEDFNKIGMTKAGYLYGSRNRGHRSVEELENLGQPYVYFASIQDLRGSTEIGGKVSDKNHDVFSVAWDLVIVDEAHEGTQTDLAQNVLDAVLRNKRSTKLLELSGTPFNLLSDYDEEEIFTWDYTMEQEAKLAWSEEHPNEVNPYETLPKVSMYTFEMSDHFKEINFTGDGLGKYSFNFKEFFRTNENGKFVHEEHVRRFLENITSPGPTNYPFANRAFRNNLRHTLWILPGIKECNALEDLLNEPGTVFHEEGYKVVNVVRGDKTADEEASQSDVERVNRSMDPDPAKTKTITLTVRKMTTGVTIKPWTGVLFLSNTNSAMQYLQAAFRAQTPYASETFGQKTNCYIFDFAPDRALTVMAEASSLSTGAGKLNSGEQVEQMTKLLNFLPIIGEKGNKMHAYNVNTLLTKLKKAYAEKAVRSGFDDNSIYSDKLLNIENKEILAKFNKLKAIVGTTKKEKQETKIDINKQGLTEKEAETARKARKKKPKERTKEEQEAIDKVNALKRQRRALISILRGISIRIPMMIYGMDIDFDEDVSIQQFMNRVDEVSWKEFMPAGVTKEMFKQFIPYYDSEIFIEAGKIIRRRVKELDKADPFDRVEKIADIFGTFRNPDKETVLTPWRVVNMHLGKTIGGLVYYDDDYETQYVDGKSAMHWVSSENTERVYHENTRILEINAKTGLYPLFAAASLYWKEFQKMNDQTAGKFSLIDEQFIWQKILRENIFVVAKTPMAKEIAIRTLRGYNSDWDVNAEYVENIIKDAKTDVDAEAKKIEGLFGNMKFDVVIGNPPYQDSATGDNDNYAAPIYSDFMDLSYKLSDLVTLITPARFLFNAGGTSKQWNKKILNDPHFKVVLYEANSSNIFPHTDIKGGVAVSLRDEHQKFEPIEIFTAFPELNSILKKVLPKTNGSLSEIILGRGVYKLSDKALADHPEIEQLQSKGHKKDVGSGAFRVLKDVVFFKEKPSDGHDDYVRFLGLSNRTREYWWGRQIYQDVPDSFYHYKVFVPKANGSGSLGETLTTPLIGEPLIGEPLIGATETFISIGDFLTEIEATNCLSYIKSKFARVMLGVLKTTQDNTRAKWEYVPLQDFTSNSDIDWTKSIPEIDQQLYKKYNLSEDEINFIETKVQAMD
ncbi:Eco57I restriction-modification methylase domain-containing protein [Lactobacillus delbrueckii]|uniref:Eco57I restriction-modification methylase domain-containing protein n=1 Tax=Lactobacillus delbrueckii TaxID=1584 RepID=UPI000680C62E|nr:Eco57I restriction-modification methylase domain-containing protein [Lactobacillus delbrueckii]APP03086.1 restriction endonuclease [Lactobacillus delbrueckii subsp. indicus]KNE30615.1 restriction endonuclease [Lactobacillus delbrueckii subsp. indicus]